MTIKFKLTNGTEEFIKVISEIQIPMLIIDLSNALKNSANHIVFAEHFDRKLFIMKDMIESIEIFEDNVSNSKNYNQE